MTNNYQHYNETRNSNDEAEVFNYLKVLHDYNIRKQNQCGEI